MKNALVAYFSAEAGTTRRIAEGLADAVAADLYEIKPEKPYSEADLRWTNPLARCNREKLGKKDVPVEGKVPGWAEYDTVYLGFPIWYYGAPNVIQTFCKGYDWSGKKIYIFATSGGSGIGKTAQKLEVFVRGGTIADARRAASVEELSGWKNA
jgi:flavodoxin